MVIEGLTDSQARARVFMVDRIGLLTQGMTDLLDFQERLVQLSYALKEWKLTSGSAYANLMDVISNTQASILIGVSGKPGLFTEEVIRQMLASCPRPIILPLSNPSQHVEAHPQDVVTWTDGKAIVATGSPFEEVEHNGKPFEISQCNNSYVFPGVGLGVISCKAKLVSDEMLMVASTTLAELSPGQEDQSSAVLPPLTALPQISRKIAFKVAKAAIAQDLAREMTDDELLASIERNFWTPAYREYRRVA
jgi:malate dehydrogenase (oxaloacetate-decarboxylating)